MLEDALIELVQYVGGDGKVDVGIGKTDPERLLHAAADVEHHTLGLHSSTPSPRVPCLSNDLFCELRGTQFHRLVFAEHVRRTLALRTRPVLGASDETLLRVVGDVGGEDGEYFADAAVPAGHLYALFTRGDEGLDDEAHGGVEDALRPRLVFAFRKPLPRYLRDGQVAEQDTRMLGWLATDSAGNVAKGEVDGVRGLISRKLRELSLIRRDDDRRYCRAFRKASLVKSVECQPPYIADHALCDAPATRSTTYPSTSPRRLASA